MSANEYVVINGKRYAAMAGAGAETSSGEPAGLVVSAKNINEIFTPVTPMIYTNAGGTSKSGSSVIINSGAAAGSKHVEDASPSEVDALVELVGFEFSVGDEIKFATLSLSVVGLGASEVQALKFVVNGDVVSDATQLNSEIDVSWVLRNETLEVTSGTTNYITRIACLATNSAVATAVATGAKIICMGYK